MFTIFLVVVKANTTIGFFAQDIHDGKSKYVTKLFIERLQFIL